jgi:SAM-dependent methyltransferase
MSRLTTRPIASTEDLVRHFDRIAPVYEDTHGRARSLLRYRLSIIERLLGVEQPDAMLLEVGCGKAIHLIALAARFGRALGTDISAQMLEGARRSAQASAWADRIELRVDPAERLATVGDASVDAVLCVGALEHMLDKSGALAQVRRVLKVGGRFVCLTPNGDYCWYRVLAPRLGLDTRHLSTDRFVNASELRALIERAGMEPQRLERWRFIPKGDLPPVCGRALHGLDLVGQVAGGGALRGGLAVLARRTQ